MNHKRVYRLYRQDGLSLRLKKPRRNVSAADRVRQPVAAAANEMWSMDFVSDALFDERHLRALTIVDTYTREALAIDVDQGIKGDQVVDAMARIAGMRGTRTADSRCSASPSSGSPGRGNLTICGNMLVRPRE